MSDTDFLFSRRFGGTTRLYGDDTLQRFRKAYVYVVGAGGVDSWTIGALVRTGIGRLALINLGNVAESNVNRQPYTLTDGFDKPEVTTLRECILQINPQCEMEEIEDSVDKDSLGTLFRRPFDFVIGAIDQVRVKATVAAYFAHSGRPFIISGDTGGRKNPAPICTADLSRVTYGPSLANLCYTLRKRYGFSRGTKGKVRVPYVYSIGNITPPQSGGACAAGTSPQGLSYAGCGASMLAATAFGLYCTQATVDAVAADMRSSESIGKGKTR